jgi:hypothetical protein
MAEAKATREARIDTNEPAVAQGYGGQAANEIHFCSRHQRLSVVWKIVGWKLTRVIPQG